MTAPTALQQATHDRKVLLQTARAIMMERDLGRLLTFIIESVSNLLDAERSTLFLVDADTQELWSRIAQGSEVKEIRLPIGKGIAGTVARTRARINIPDAYADPRFDRATDLRTGYHTRSLLCLPMFDREGETLGVLQVLNKRGGPFTDTDEELLEALAAQASVAIENAQLYEETKRVFRSLVQTLAAAIDARDPATAGHSERVAYYARRLAQALALPPEQCELLEYAALLHDVGKIGVRDAVLLKEGKLTDEEFAVIRSHAAQTRDILANIWLSHALHDLPDCAAAHHEKFDGSGYPNRLRGEDIPLLARIIAVADVYDALVAQDRPYKKAMPVAEALARLEAGAGTHFDPALVRLFIDRKLYELERRHCTRYALDLTVYFRPLDRFEVVRRLATAPGNVSATGLMFYTEEALAIGTHIYVTLVLPDGEFEALGQVMRVVWHASLGQHEIGVRLVNLPQQLAQRLETVLKRCAAEGKERPA